MNNPLTRIFRSRQPARVDMDMPLAYHVAPDGKVSAVKASGGNVHFSAYSNLPVNSTPEGYAYAAIVSVWAYRCVELRSQTVARMRWYMRDKKTKKELPNHPLMVALRRATQRILRRYEWSQLIWGETFLWPRRNTYQYASDLKWLNNLRVDVDTTMGYISRFTYYPQAGGKTHLFQPQEIAYFFTDNPFDDLRGLSRFESILLEVGIDKDIARTTRAFYANDARPGIMLIPENDIPTEKAQEFMDYWKKNLQGARNAGKPVLMPKSIKDVKDFQRSPGVDDVELRESVRREICAAFGVPLSIAGAWDDAQYQSAPEQRKSFYEETIIPECENLREDMNQKLVPFFDEDMTSEIDFDATEIMALTENAQEKATVANSKLLAGGITLNEYRVQNGDPVIKNGDVFYIPSGMMQVPVDQIGVIQPKPSYLPFGNPQMTPQQSAEMAQSIGLNVPTPIDADVTQPPNAPIPGTDIPTVGEGWTETEKTLGLPLAVMLNIGAHPDLVALQSRVKELVGNVPVEWNDPQSFHVTLLYAPSASDEQVTAFQTALNSVDLSEMDLRVGSLKVFDALGQYAIHFRVRENADLRELQETIYDIAEGAGVGVSQHSEPARYIPHITIGYAQAKPRSVIFDGKLTVAPSELILNCEDKTVYRRACNPEPERSAPDEELAAWEKKALNKGASKAITFQCYALPDDIQEMVRHGLAEHAPDKPSIKTLFSVVREELKKKPDDEYATPEQYERYWGRYDQLLKEIGSDWINEYMAQAWDVLREKVSPDLTRTEIRDSLAPFRQDLLDAWIGTQDQPGVLTKLALAGMSAGQTAIEDQRVSINPLKADVSLEVDWTLLSKEAIAFVKRYVPTLIRGLNQTTLDQVMEILKTWTQSGEPLDVLIDALDDIFHDRTRAEMIAQTESTRIYTEGAFTRWENAGVVNAKWQTVRDSKVCLICKPLHNIVGTIEEGWHSAVLNQYIKPPAHPRCRCFPKPVVE